MTTIRPFSSSIFLQRDRSPSREAAEKDIKTVKTDDRTLELISTGDSIIYVTRTFFPLGAGNQEKTIRLSKGYSVVKMQETRTTLYKSSNFQGVLDFIPENYQEIMRGAAVAMEVGGGNCFEHANISFALARAYAPLGTWIYHSYYPDLDHDFVLMSAEQLIGDARRHENSTVVIDSWSIYAQAVLLKDFKFYEQDLPEYSVAMQADGIDGYTERRKNVVKFENPPPHLTSIQYRKELAREDIFDHKFAGKYNSFYSYDADFSESYSIPDISKSDPPSPLRSPRHSPRYRPY